eukprot:392940-Ditylum_brightwellii.AAC.1
MEKQIRLILTVSVDTLPGHCIVFYQNLLHSGAKGLLRKKQYRLFSHCTHDAATGGNEGPAVKKEKPVNTYVAYCGNVGCLCHCPHSDAWVVTLLSLSDGETIGDIRYAAIGIDVQVVNKK